MQAALERERAEQEAERKAAFLAQLGRDSAAGGDVYSCGAGVFGQHGHGHTKDAGKAPSLVQGAERAVFRRVAAGETSSFYVPELEGGDETDVTGGGAALLLASGSGSFGQLGLIECSVPVAGEIVSTLNIAPPVVKPFTCLTSAVAATSNYTAYIPRGGV